MRIEVHPLTRVEGHGAIHVRVRDGKVEEARWDVVETPRFFEAMLRGRRYDGVGLLTARVCGICSIGHCLASTIATEKAFGITPPPLAQDLRLLAKHGETIASHALHVLFLAAPDFLGLHSAIPLKETHPELFALAARLKKAGNRLAEVVAGRAVHPVSIVVGGMAREPDVRPLADDLLQALADLDQLAGLFATLQPPDFERQTEYVAVAGAGPYPWWGDRVVSTDGVDAPVEQYRSLTNERVVPRNTTKWCSLSRDTYAVGALARLHNHADRLHPQAQMTASRLGLPSVSPFGNNGAQIVEMVHVVHDALAIIDRLEDGEVRVPVAPRAGTGVSAVEVPRGTLYHALSYDTEGRITEADCVIPTTQNNANIDADIKALAEQLAREGATDEEAELQCSMLVRAYDPCISCAVH